MERDGGVSGIEGGEQRPGEHAGVGVERPGVGDTPGDVDEDDEGQPDSEGRERAAVDSQPAGESRAHGLNAFGHDIGATAVADISLPPSTDKFQAVQS